MIDKLLYDMLNYINSFEILNSRKYKLYIIFKNYIEKKELFYREINCFSDDDINSYLVYNFNSFKKRLAHLLFSYVNPYEYINYIKKCCDMENKVHLSSEDKRMFHMILDPSFDIDEASLVNDNTNFSKLYDDIIYLALTLGYRPNNTNKKHVYKDDLIPKEIKDAIKKVEK